MKKYCYLIILLLLFTLLVSCSDRTTQKTEYELIKSDSLINIHIGKSVDPVTNNLDYYTENGMEYLIYAHMNDLHLFDLKSREKIEMVRYQQYGPDGIGNLNGFYIHNLDSIFLFNHFGMILTNSKGKVLKRIKLHDHIDENILIAINPNNSHIYNRTINQNNRLLIPTYSIEFKPEIVETLPMGLIYELEDDSITLSKNLYPKKKGHEYGSSRVVNDSIIVYSFLDNHSLFVYNQNNPHKEYYCKSKYAPRTFTDLGVGSDLRESVMISIEMQKYSSLLYDPYKKLYYRIFYPGYEVDKNQTLEYYWIMKDNLKVFSVMIINEQFEAIGETLMPEDHYNPDTYFINKDGLHFSLHVNHPEFDADYLKFVNFKIEKK